MKPLAILDLGLVALASASYHMNPPRPPQPPRAPHIPPTESFKPIAGTHVDSKRSGVEAFPHAKKPKGYFSPY